MTTPRVLLAALGLLVAAGCGGEGKDMAKKGLGFEGRWRADAQNGPVVLSMTESGGSVTVTMNGQTITGRVTAPGRLEGEESTEQGGGKFVFELKGGRLAARFTLVGPSGEPAEVPEITFDRLADAPAAGARDAAIAGHWRHTDARASGDFSLVTDVHILLAEDGTFATWTVSAGSSRDRTESPHATGVWKTDGRRLYLLPDGETEWREKGAYAVSGSNLMFTYGPGHRQVFERI